MKTKQPDAARTRGTPAKEPLSLHSRVVAAQENERRRLARELHDGVGQILSGVKFRLESLPEAIAFSAEPAAEVRRVGGFLDRAVSEIRRVSENLMPSELERLGLEPALRTLCREFNARAGGRASLRSRGVPKSVGRETGLALFRIAQESLNNVEKHAGAAEVALTLARSGGGLALSVVDDGKGFSPKALSKRAALGIGLENMRERAESLGGTFELRSRPGRGTAVLVRVPLPARRDPRSRL